MCYYTKTRIDPMTNAQLSPPEPVYLTDREDADLRLLASFTLPDQIVCELGHTIEIYDRDPLQQAPASGIMFSPQSRGNTSCQKSH